MATRALADRARITLARGHRVLSSKTYWRAMQRRYPTTGLDQHQLTAALDTLRALPAPVRPVRALPRTHVVGGKVVYAQQRIGTIEADLQLAWRRLGDGTATALDVAALTAAGLAFECRPALRNPAGWTLIVAPHRDDAPLAVGGIMAAHADVTVPVVLNLFTISGWLGEGFAVRTIEHVTALRAMEERLSGQILGARSVSLGLWEIDLRAFARRTVDRYAVGEDFRFRQDPHLRTADEVDAIAGALRAVVASLRPRRLLAPLGVGGHADHLSAKDAVTAALPDLRRRAPQMRVELYEDQPYATYDGADPAAVAGDRLQPVVEDVTDQFEAKMQAIAAHRSQFSRAENEARLRAYAADIAKQAGLPSGHLAERVWRVP